MFFIENFKLAISSLKANKMRAFLTMLGIIIGISSVITIFTLGEIGKASMGKEFEGIGVNRIVVYLSGREEINSEDFLNNSDFQTIKRAFKDDIDYLSPSTWGSGKAKKNKNMGKIYINGVNEEYKFIAKINMIKGRFLNKSDVLGKKSVAVIDKKLALELFKRTDVVGETFKVENSDLGQSYVIVGVYEVPTSLFDKIDKSEETSIYVPHTFIQYGDSYDSVELSASKNADIELLSQKITKFMEKLKNKENLYRVMSAQSQMNMIDNFLGKMSLGIGAIAAISLLVGGIGVMNIMLVSVTERTREIGIRKALGAKRKDILFQFLVEAMIISGVGGIIGTSLGLGISNIIALFLKVTPSVPIGIIIIAVSFSAGVGMFFGIYPANKAAKLDPIEALRYE